MCNRADKHAEHLVHATRKCLERGIEVCGPGVPYKRVGQAIECASSPRMFSFFCSYGCVM